MNNTKALKILNENLQTAIHDCDGFNPTYEQEQVKALQIAVNAVEKQIPKKTIKDTNYSHGRYTVAICPICDDLLGLYSFAETSFKCCPTCGQALDWSDTE